MLVAEKKLLLTDLCVYKKFSRLNGFVQVYYILLSRNYCGALELFFCKVTVDYMGHNQLCFRFSNSDCPTEWKRLVKVANLSLPFLKSLSHFSHRVEVLLRPTTLTQIGTRSCQWHFHIYRVLLLVARKCTLLIHSCAMHCDIYCSLWHTLNCKWLPSGPTIVYCDRNKVEKSAKWNANDSLPHDCRAQKCCFCVIC